MVLLFAPELFPFVDEVLLRMEVWELFEEHVPPATTTAAAAATALLLLLLLIVLLCCD